MAFIQQTTQLGLATQKRRRCRGLISLQGYRLSLSPANFFENVDSSHPFRIVAIIDGSTRQLILEQSILGSECTCSRYRAQQVKDIKTWACYAFQELLRDWLLLRNDACVIQLKASAVLEDRVAVCIEYQLKETECQLPMFFAMIETEASAAELRLKTPVTCTLYRDPPLEGFVNDVLFADPIAEVWTEKDVAANLYGICIEWINLHSDIRVANRERSLLKAAASRYVRSCRHGNYKGLCNKLPCYFSAMLGRAACDNRTCPSRQLAAAMPKNWREIVQVLIYQELEESQYCARKADLRKVRVDLQSPREAIRDFEQRECA